jgi:hypothetical protein
MEGNYYVYTRFNDVWRSFDGKTWMEVTHSAAWGDRSYYTSFVLGEATFEGGVVDVASHDVWFLVAITAVPTVVPTITPIVVPTAISTSTLTVVPTVLLTEVPSIPIVGSEWEK